MFREDPRDDVRRRLLTRQNRDGTIQERKRKAISQTVSEWQSRRREQAIVRCKPQHFIAEGFLCVEDVALPVNGAFRLTSAAGCVEDESGIGWTRLGEAGGCSFCCLIEQKPE